MPKRKKAPISKLKIAAIAGASVLAFAIFLCVLVLIGFSFYRWTPTVFATPKTNVIPAATYDFTYTEQFGPDSKVAFRTDATGRINLAPGACQLNATSTQWQAIYPKETATYHAVREANGPTYVSTNMKAQHDTGFYDTRELYQSAQPISYFPALFAGKNSSEFGSYCGFTALGALTTPSKTPGVYEWQLKPLIALGTATSSEQTVAWQTGLGMPEPMYSVAARAKGDSDASYARTGASLGSVSGNQFRVTTDKGTGVVTLTAGKKGDSETIRLVLTPTDQKVDTTTPKGALPAVDRLIQEVKKAGGVNAWQRANN